ncbi:MAG: YfhO family protein [Anaerolineae bacterium]|nr:YfhO family protein [Anaerolineae bacterium]
MRWSRSDLWPLLFLAALVLSLVGPALVGRAGFPPGDFVDQFYAFAHFAAQEMAHGRLPLWNPYTFSGHPFLADIQSGIFYPPNLVMLLLAALLGGDLPLWALYAQVALHLFLAGAFTYLLARDRLGDRGAALIAALAFALGGYLTSYPVLQLAVLQTDTWLPLLLWLVEKRLKTEDEGQRKKDERLKIEDTSSERPTRRPPSSVFNLQSTVFYLTIAWAMALLPGHPQSVMYVGYTVLAWAVYRAWALGIGWWRGVVPVALSALIGLGLAAVQYLPSLEYMQLSVRAAASYDRLAHGFPFRDLVGLVVPGLVSLWSPLYVGLVPLALAVVALARGARRGDTRFWAGLSLVALLLSFGGSLFVYPVFYLLVPGFNLFQSQERAALLVSFSLAMLAGIGGIGIREWGLGGRQRGQSTNSHEWTRTGRAQGTVFSLQSLILNPFILVALTALDLWRVAAPLLIGAPLPPDLGYPAALVAPAQAAPGPLRVENEYRLPANWGILAGVKDTWGASPLRTQHYADFYASVPAERRRRMLNVGLVLTWHGDSPGQTEVTRLPVKNPVTGAPETTFLLRTEPGPRAWFVAQAARVDDATALARLADPQFDPWRVALLAAETPEAVGGNLETLPTSSPPLPTQGTPVSIVEVAPGHLAYDFDAPMDGLLALSEVWYPGWQATVDGSPAPALRAHLTLMAVPVSAGPRHVELRFDPPLVKIGLAVSSGMLLVTLGALAADWRVRSRGGAA